MAKAIKDKSAFESFVIQIENHVMGFGYTPLMAYYRGCPKATHTLTPSLFRNMHKIKDALPVGHLENNLYYDFSSYADGILQNKGDWDVLFKMQHHGIPTRLLDWTENLGIALYFALEFSRDIDKPCVWVLNPFKLNDTEKGKKAFTHLAGSTLYNPTRDFSISYYNSFVAGSSADRKKVFNKPKALYPVKSNERIRSQWGVFTIHGNSMQCLSKQVASSVKRFIIPDNAIDDARLFLKRAGISHFSMFPDMQGLKNLLDSEYYNP